MIQVDFDRLVEMIGIDETHKWCWDECEPFTLEDIAVLEAKGEVGIGTPYGDQFQYLVHEKRDRNYHMHRVLWFVQHPNEIAGIQIDNATYFDGYTTVLLPGCEVEDGWHRMAAGMFLKLTTVQIEYGGREDIENYLTGKSDIKPEEAF